MDQPFCVSLLSAFFDQKRLNFSLIEKTRATAIGFKTLNFENICIMTKKTSPSSKINPKTQNKSIPAREPRQRDMIVHDSEIFGLTANARKFINNYKKADIIKDMFRDPEETAEEIQVITRIPLRVSEIVSDLYTIINLKTHPEFHTIGSVGFKVPDLLTLSNFKEVAKSSIMTGEHTPENYYDLIQTYVYYARTK